MNNSHQQSVGRHNLVAAESAADEKGWVQHPGGADKECQKTLQPAEQQKSPRQTKTALQLRHPYHQQDKAGQRQGQIFRRNDLEQRKTAQAAHHNPEAEGRQNVPQQVAPGKQGSAGVTAQLHGTMDGNNRQRRQDIGHQRDQQDPAA